MAYQIPITIKKAIENIRKRNYVLPSIQREFVWGTDQIETLFDSLMRGYPIGTFLFWSVDKGKIKDFQFYEFLREYHETNNTRCKKADISDEQDIIAVLDGQQRITSFYLALTGTYAYKRPYISPKKPDAYPKRKLYLNLLKPSDKVEAEYDFRFLTEEVASNPNEGSHWFPCSEIMNFDDGGVITYLTKNKLMDSSVYTEKQSNFAGKTLNAFFNAIHKNGTISFYLEEGEELDKVLQIFIRINSGGTKLSYSDLLLSIATAQWNEEDAREVIHAFVDDINKIDPGFAFHKDLVLKSCLVLADFSDVRFRVDNFNKDNMRTIEKNWGKTSSSLRAAIKLVANFGYNAKNLIATNAIIPIAYFIYKNGFEEDEILSLGSRESDREAIKEWLARVLLKGTFGGNPDSIYPGMRDLINDNLGHFPLKETIDFYKGKSKSISFSSDEIDNLLESQYGKPKTYCALTLIYPGLSRRFEYHQDHIHPKSKFNERSMKEAGFSDEQIEQFNAEVNGIANLQLLDAADNREKNDTPFKEWLTSNPRYKSGMDHYLQYHHISPDQSLEFEDFMDFVSMRRKTIKGLFTSILNPTSEEIGVDEEFEIE